MNNLLNFKSFFKFLSRQQTLATRNYAVISETFAHAVFEKSLLSNHK